MAPDRGTRRSWGRPPARPRIGGDGGESNSPSRNHRRRPLRACPIVCRRTLGRPSATCRALQSRSLAGFSSDYATLLGTAPPLNDASAAHGGEAVSTFTLLPKQRGRKQTGCCQLLRLGSFLRGLETNLDSRSPVTGPCRNHASPQSGVPSPVLGPKGPYDRRPRIVPRRRMWAKAWRLAPGAKGSVPASGWARAWELAWEQAWEREDCRRSGAGR
jgi:hypothetical protein